MRSEDDTPYDQRFLFIEGKCSAAALALVRKGLPEDLPPDSEVLMMGFAYADLPFSKQYHIVFPAGRPRDGVRCRCKITAATQQFGIPDNMIPHGWKMIIVVQFDGDIPDLIRQLPVVDDWYESKTCVCLCDEHAWEYLKTAVPQDR